MEEDFWYFLVFLLRISSFYNEKENLLWKKSSITRGKAFYGK